MNLQLLFQNLSIRIWHTSQYKAANISGTMIEIITTRRITNSLHGDQAQTIDYNVCDACKDENKDRVSNMFGVVLAAAMIIL